jgi:hypothetical protein
MIPGKYKFNFFLFVQRKISGIQSTHGQRVEHKDLSKLNQSFRGYPNYQLFGVSREGWNGSNLQQRASCKGGSEQKVRNQDRQFFLTSKWQAVTKTRVGWATERALVATRQKTPETGKSTRTLHGGGAQGHKRRFRKRDLYRDGEYRRGRWKSHKRTDNQRSASKGPKVVDSHGRQKSLKLRRPG